MLAVPTLMLKQLLYRLYERQLLAEVLRAPLPHHVGLIQDGHRRYTRDVGLATLSHGYRRGAEKTEEVLLWCTEVDIRTMTLWALSTDNLARPADEVADILHVIEKKMVEWVQGGLAQRIGMRIRPIGHLELLPASALEALRVAEAATRHHDRRLLNVAVGYGGRQEIVDAVKGHLQECFDRGDRPEEILESMTPSAVDKHLYTYDCPDPDLIIRTSGELRLSGFMLWQSAYSEFYFCDAHWPALRKIDFLRAIRSYQRRQRRFGR